MAAEGADAVEGVGGGPARRSARSTRAAALVLRRSRLAPPAPLRRGPPARRPLRSERGARPPRPGGACPSLATARVSRTRRRRLATGERAARARGVVLHGRELGFRRRPDAHAHAR